VCNEDEKDDDDCTYDGSNDGDDDAYGKVASPANAGLLNQKKAPERNSFGGFVL
jgi:hypothetical protein